MEFYKDNWTDLPAPKKKLKVIVVGGGIAGLVTGIALGQSGHHVIILEQSEEFTEVGAGIQLAPNNTRILGRLGVLAPILQHANLLEKISIRRWKDDEELDLAPYMPQLAERYGAPLGVIHRCDLQEVLLEAARKANCQIETNHTVIKVDATFEARVQVQCGKWYQGDIVIGADGIKSSLRRHIAIHHGHEDRTTSTGDSAYRILIPKDKMKHDPSALELLSRNMGMRWMGPGGHVMAYPIRRNTMYNMVLLRPEHEDGIGESEVWNRKGDKQEMLDFYKDWCPQIGKLISYVPEGEVVEWTLRSHWPLPSWHENKVVLIGDACHPMLPYVAQGAAQAMEDAAVLQCVLAKSSTDIPLALKVYEIVRKERAEKVQASAVVTRKALHLPDGPEQQERDRQIKAAAVARKGKNPDLWADIAFQEFVWGIDIMKETVVRWSEWQALAQGTQRESRL